MPPNPSARTALRRDAEARLRHGPKRPKTRTGDPSSGADSQRMLHELQVHQVELELQNVELQETRDRMELSVERYTDLYDFAPVGYFSLDQQGRIQEANLTGAGLLGLDRSRLLGRRLVEFVAAPSQSLLVAFLERVFAGTEKQVCEINLRRAGGTTFWANLHGVAALSTKESRPWCRVSVSDLTSLKQAEEAQRRMELLERKNRELRTEIVRREAVESSLRQSEKRQRQLLEQSRRLQKQARDLSRRLLRVQEDERKRISRELHDEIAQILVGIHVGLENLARDLSVDPRALRRKITRTQRLVEKSVNRVQQFARELRPTSLDDLGLIASLHSCLKDFAKRTGIRVQFTAFSGVEQLSNARRIALYRVAHSAVTNVSLHARARSVKLSLRQVSNSVCMKISDDGEGFDVERMLRAKRNAHLGLLGMRERIEMVGGKLSVESSPGQGTTIRILIPFGKKLPNAGGGGVGD